MDRLIMMRKPHKIGTNIMTEFKKNLYRSTVTKYYEDKNYTLSTMRRRLGNVELPTSKTKHVPRPRQGYSAKNHTTVNNITTSKLGEENDNINKEKNWYTLQMQYDKTQDNC